MTDENPKASEPFDIVDPSEVPEVVDDHSDSPEEVTEVAGQGEAVAGDSGSDEYEYEYEYEDGEETKAEQKTEVDLGVVEDYLDADLAKTVKGVIQSMSDKISDLEKKLEARPAAEPAQDSQIFAGHEELFGSDEPSPDQIKNRGIIREQMDVLRGGYKAAKKKVPSTRSIFEKALRSEFSDAVIDQDRKQFSEKVQSRERKILSRPTSRSADPTSAKQRATNAVKKKMRELGLS